MKSSTLTACALLLAGAAAQSTTDDVPPAWQTGVRTEDGTCGKGNPQGWVCTPTWGACCSKDGVCGRSNAFCSDGCQLGYGNCNAPTAPPPGPGDPSPDGSCGGTSQFNCTNTTFGTCCSASGFCGTTVAHCGAGCQTLFGNGCAAGAGNMSTDGRCGSGAGGDSKTCAGSGCGKNGKTCKGSASGDCCSAGGFCGKTSDHCGAGCQSGFGTCDSGSGAISTDGVCGAKNGKTWKGSMFGTCCSSGGFCGSTGAHCGQGWEQPNELLQRVSHVQHPFGGRSGGFCGTTSGYCESGCQMGYGRCN
ncbi:lectin-B [Parachaetomium inaequale]|uniref:Lectin-B n=1 Tax=Parachaetomium inaequale TaxID=2588326 RepID=A0AAN6P7V4_9PEZI|nr:lectin-B [Parachaetomium inaequale]